MVRTVFMLPDGTIAYVRPENEFRKGGSSKRFLEIPSWKANRRIQTLAGKSERIDKVEMQTRGIKPHKKSLDQGGVYSYDRFESQLTDEEGEELRSLMIEAALGYEPGLGYSGNGMSTDDNAPPFEEKLKVAKVNTLQKWALFGGVYYSVVTAELDELRCVKDENENKYIGVQNPSNGEIIGQMRKHAKQPFAMDLHHSSRELMDMKKMNPKAPGVSRMIANPRATSQKDTVNQVRKLIIYGQGLKTDNKGNYHMYNDGVHGSKSVKNILKEDLPRSSTTGTIKTKSCDECGMIPIKLNDVIADSTDRANVKEYLKGFGLRIGSDNIVSLLHLEQFFERYGLATDPDTNVIGDQDKCRYMISEATVSRMTGDYSPQDIDKRVLDLYNEVSILVNSNLAAANYNAKKPELKRKITSMREIFEINTGTQYAKVLGIYKKRDYVTWVQNLESIKNMIDQRRIVTLSARQ